MKWENCKVFHTLVKTMARCISKFQKIIQSVFSVENTCKRQIRPFASYERRTTYVNRIKHGAETNKRVLTSDQTFVFHDTRNCSLSRSIFHLTQWAQSFMQIYILRIRLKKQNLDGELSFCIIGNIDVLQIIR